MPPAHFDPKGPYPELPAFFKVLSTTVDRRGRPFEGVGGRTWPGRARARRPWARRPHPSQTLDPPLPHPYRHGLEYVSSIEARDYPFFGTQWHPEKPPYEFSDTTIPHSRSAVSVSHHLADTFVDLARQCPHKRVEGEKG